jgi:small subunit ribosomal protein S1
MYQKGDDVEAVVLNIDVDNERFSLGIKQLHEDPWGRIPSDYPRGTRVKGTITKVTEFGAFIEIEAGIEGLCHVSEFSDKHVDNPREHVNVGTETEVMIIDVDAEERRIGLSIKAVAKAEAGIDYRAYLAETAKPVVKGTNKGSMGTLGDALGSQLANLKNSEEDE